MIICLTIVSVEFNLSRFRRPARKIWINRYFIFTTIRSLRATAMDKRNGAYYVCSRDFAREFCNKDGTSEEVLPQVRLEDDMETRLGESSCLPGSHDKYLLA